MSTDSPSAGATVGSSPLKGSTEDEKNVTGGGAHEASVTSVTVGGELPVPSPPKPKRPIPPRTLSTSGYNVRIPIDAEATEHVKQTYGQDSWEHKVLKVLHHKTVQIFLACLLLLDVIIAFTELALWSIYPRCEIIKRDGINCCPIATEEQQVIRMLAEDGESSHEHICENPELTMFTAETVGCDEHKWHVVHTVEHVCFGFTMAILSIFMIELLVLMAAVRPWVFFRHLFYAIDFIVVAGSIVLEAMFHSLGNDLAQSLASFLIVVRIWRFVRIGHSIVEMTAELSDEKYQELLTYTEGLEDMIKKNNMEIPEGWTRPGMNGGKKDIFDEIEKSERDEHRREYLEESGNSGTSAT